MFIFEKKFFERFEFLKKKRKIEKKDRIFEKFKFLKNLNCQKNLKIQILYIRKQFREAKPQEAKDARQN